MSGKIERYVPRYEPLWKMDGHGARHAHLFTEEGLVEVYSFPGDDRTEPFTSLNMYLHPHIYSQRFGRSYHDRWLMRLAKDFAWECRRMRDGIGK
jgi:hypothetical protein